MLCRTRRAARSTLRKAGWQSRNKVRRHLISPTQGLDSIPPVQVLVQELEGPNPMNRMRTVEEFDLRAVANTQLIIKPSDLGVFRCHPFINSHSILVATFHYERARSNQRGHLRVIEQAT